MRLGDVVAGRFELVAVAGSGGMGVVYRARDLVAGDHVAVKTLREVGEHEAARFAREAALLVELAHPGIVRYVAHGLHDHQPYLAMEWVDGATLHDYLATALRAARRVAVADAVTLARAVAAALAAAHRRGIVHRDLKPANVILAGDDLARPKLLDFGIARQAATAGVLTRTGVVVGTPGFMAPEQVRGEVHAIDARSDVFALGCVMYRCLAGVPAFAGDSLAVLAKILVDEVPPPSVHARDVPAALDRLVMRALAKSPAERPADAGAVEAELADIAAALGAGATLATLSAPRSRDSAEALDDTIAASSALPTPAITTTEHRLVTIVLAARVGRAGGEPPPPPPTDATEAPALAARVAAIATTFGGRTDTIAGGIALVVFAQAGAATDHAAHAARCALALHDVVPELALTVASGRAAIDGPLAGEAIDKGVALLADLAPGAIAIDDATRLLLDHRFAVAGTRLVGMTDAEPARLLLGRATPLVGRDRELATLAGLWADCVDEPVARAVLITAPAGAGKSRLRAEMQRAIVARDPTTTVLVGRGDAVGAGSPFAMLADLVRRAAGVRDGDALDTQRAALIARIAATLRGDDVPRVAHLLGELAGVAFPTDASPTLRAARSDPTAKAELTRAAWLDWLTAACAVHPVLVVLDDLHWGDATSVDYVGAALRKLAAAPIMVVAVARPEVHDLFPRLWHDRDLQEIRLPGLTRKAAERLVRELLGATADPAIVQRIVERADGNAFFLEELIRAVAEGRTELPESVLAMLQQRLDALDPDTRRALRAASTFGDVFWRGGVVALTGADSRAAQLADVALDALAAGELIVASPASRLPDDREYAFRHDLVRGAAYATMTDADRALAHRLAGDWLVAHGLPDALALADHFALGGDTERAAAQLAIAAEHAYAGMDGATALALVDRGLGYRAADPVRGRLLLVRAQVLNWRADYQAAWRAGEAAAALFPRGTASWFRAHDEVFVSTARSAVLRDALASLQAITATPALPGSEVDQLRSVARAAIIMLRFGPPELGTAIARRAEELAAALTGTMDLVTVQRLWAMRAVTARDRGDMPALLAHHAETRAAAERTHDRREIAFSQLGLGNALDEIGAPRDAIAAYDDGIAVAAGIEGGAVLSLLYLSRAYAHVHLDDRAATEADVERARVFGDVAAYGIARNLLADWALRSGDYAAARDHVEFALAHVPQSTHFHAMALVMRARLRVATGDRAGARADVAQARRDTRPNHGIQDGEALVRLVEIEVLVADGERAAARAAAVAAANRLRERAARLAEPWRAMFLAKADHVATFAHERALIS
jgi:hypothetical protein